MIIPFAVSFVLWHQGDSRRKTKMPRASSCGGICGRLVSEIVPRIGAFQLEGTVVSCPVAGSPITSEITPDANSYYLRFLDGVKNSYRLSTTEMPRNSRPFHVDRRSQLIRQDGGR